MDLGSFVGKQEDLQSFLELSVAETGRSYSHEAGTARRLERSFVTLGNQSRTTRAEPDDLLGRALETCGLELVPLGPLHLRVFAVEPRKK